MEQEKITAQTNCFRSWLVAGAAIFCALAFLLGLPGIGMLLNADYRSYLLQDLLDGGVTTGSARTTYLVTNGAILLTQTVFSGILALSLALFLGKQGGRGFGLLATVTQWAARGINLVGILLVGIYIFRFAAYTIACLRTNGGIYPLYAMVISEGVMGVLAWFLFMNLRKFINCLCDSAASMAYTFATGNLDTHSISGFTATGFLLLAFGSLLMMADQLFTLTIVYDLHPYYKLLISSRFAQQATAASFFCSAVADVLLFFYFRKYKRICERLLYQKRKQILKMDP